MKKPRAVSSKSLKSIKVLLSKARDRYDNKLLEIEKLWSKLPSLDYRKRKLITDLTTEMITIDKSIKEWEEKIESWYNTVYE